MEAAQIAAVVFDQQGLLNGTAGRHYVTSLVVY